MNIPSVTRVLSPYSDFSMVPEHVLENAARRGTKVHGICAAIAQNLWVPNIPDDCVGFVESFRSWFPVVDEVAMVERDLVHADLGYHGHPDLIVRIKGDDGLTLVDLKTPAAKIKLWRVQLAAYRELARVSGFEVKRAGSLRLKKDGGFPIFDEYKSHKRDMAAFLGALSAWKYFKAA